MERVLHLLEEIQTIDNSYDLSNEKINPLKNEMLEARVSIPVIGKFSTGKSALLNALLGYQRGILREDITPETAIPTEIVYTECEEQVTVFAMDGSEKTMSLGEFRSYEADAMEIKSARIHLNNSFLKEIPDVMLVDMPGFESRFEVHNKAIDDYLPNSLAYIITFPADDMIIRSSVGDILKELCMHDMPLCVVITKFDKADDDFEDTFHHLKKSLKRYIGNRVVEYCCTSRLTGDAEELEHFLLGIQERSQTILANKYKKYVTGIAENTENYLLTILKGNQLSESELIEKQEQLSDQLYKLDTKFVEEQEKFHDDILDCVDEIKIDVQTALQREENTLVTMVMNNQEINGRLNTLVRGAVTSSIKNRVVPKLEKYMENMSELLNGEAVSDLKVVFHYDVEQINKELICGIVAVAAAIVLQIPIIGIIAGIAMLIARESKREQKKQQIKQKLHSEVFPNILSEVANGISKQLMEQVEKINGFIGKEMELQKNTLEKAMDDLKQQIQTEQEQKEELGIRVRADLDRIKEIKDVLR